MTDNKTFTKKQTVIRVLLLVLVLIGTVLLLVYRKQIQHLEEYGYPGYLFTLHPNQRDRLIPLPGGWS